LQCLRDRFETIMHLAVGLRYCTPERIRAALLLFFV